MDNLKNGAGPQMQITEKTVKEAPILKCDCGGTIFTEKMIFKKISKFLSPTSKDEIFPMNIIICETCGKTPSEFNPGNILPEEYIASK